MTPQTVLLPEADLDRRVSAFEAAWPADPAAFLPPRESADFAAVLAELIRIDLEFRGARGQSPRLAAYRPLAPDLFADPAWVGEIAFEEYRQRLTLGESVRPADYAQDYGVDVADWPLAERAPPPALPAVGDMVGPFRVLRELGRGSFGRVYLAAQTDLAGRPVALKFSTKFGRTEPDTLARLQHTHIVPIYATERVGAAQLIVMPYLGATTLADVIAALREQAAWPASGTALADTVANRASRTKLAADPRPSPDPGRPPLHLPLDALRKLTFPDAVLWIGEKLAEALAHAHDRGILHRDLKPANVLVTDDGEPMLLDFNLARDAAGDPDAGMGGTPAYMAPEQLAAMKGGRGVVDHRADLYSLGLVLTELLTGTSSSEIRVANPAVSPSTEAILRKCLAADPADRYASAAVLAEEFRRQLAHRPLLATAEPSVRERARKWRRRHPLLASTGSVFALASVVTLALAGGLVARQRHVDALTEERAAVDTFRDFRRAAPAVVDRVLLAGREPKSRAALADLFARYGIAGDNAWTTRPAVARLPARERRELGEQVGELLLLQSWNEADGPAAVRLNEQAAGVYRQLGEVPRAVWEGRAELARRAGRPDEARDFDEQVRQSPVQARDLFLAGVRAQHADDYEQAREFFEAALRLDPRHYWSWFALGNAWSFLGREDKAEGCFNACVALNPQTAVAYYNRGLSHRRRGDYAAAVRDFGTALDLDPGHEKARTNRGIAHQEAGEWAAAAADFTRVLADGSAETRVYFLRAAVRAKRGDLAGAAADRAEGLTRPPADEISWIIRGQAKRTDDPRGAIADFDEALKRNPRSYEALMNKANVLDDRLHDEAAAVGVLTTMVDLFPRLLLPRSGRAVLLARRGDRAAAVADAEHCLKANPGRDVVYQLAGVYALTSKTHPADADTACRLLRAALRDGYGAKFLAADPDLVPLRDRPEFRQMVEAARTLDPSIR